MNFGKDIADNSWHFVVFTVDPVDSNEVQFYLDGDPAGSPQYGFEFEQFCMISLCIQGTYFMHVESWMHGCSFIE